MKNMLRLFGGAALAALVLCGCPTDNTTDPGRETGSKAIQLTLTGNPKGNLQAGDFLTATLVSYGSILEGERTPVAFAVSFVGEPFDFYEIDTASGSLAAGTKPFTVEGVYGITLTAQIPPDSSEDAPFWVFAAQDTTALTVRLNQGSNNLDWGDFSDMDTLGASVVQLSLTGTSQANLQAGETLIALLLEYDENEAPPEPIAVAFMDDGEHFMFLVLGEGRIPLLRFFTAPGSYGVAITKLSDESYEPFTTWYYLNETESPPERTFGFQRGVNKIDWAFFRETAN